ncbi:MAG: type II secretion system F family protein [Firmicutes bacterium]|jgi:Flp pilus assembly protein TadB|nr:type II secretion system F family protein [Bacillota bacterium]
MTIIMLGFLILSGLLFIIGKGKYKGYYERLPKKDFPMKDFMLMGKVIYEKIPKKLIDYYIGYIGEYVFKYYGRKEGSYYFEAHVVKKLTYIMIINLILPMYSVNLETTLIQGIGMIIIADILVFLLGDKELQDKCKEMDQIIMDQLPDILDKLGIMVSVNISPIEAFKVIIKDLPKGKLKSEINKLLVDIENGMDYREAFQKFSSAMRIREVSKLSTLIISYYRTGSSNIIDKFDTLAIESFMMRKRNAKIKGEQTSIKLVLPIMLFFISLILMIVVPGIMQINKLI